MTELSSKYLFGELNDDNITSVITSPFSEITEDTPVVEIIRRGKSASSLLEEDSFCELMDKLFEEQLSFAEWFVPASTEDLLNDIKKMNIVGIVFVEEDGTVRVYKES